MNGSILSPRPTARSAKSAPVRTTSSTLPVEETMAEYTLLITFCPTFRGLGLDLISNRQLSLGRGSLPVFRLLSLAASGYFTFYAYDWLGGSPVHPANRMVMPTGNSAPSGRPDGFGTPAPCGLRPFALRRHIRLVAYIKDRVKEFYIWLLLAEQYVLVEVRRRRYRYGLEPPRRRKGGCRRSSRTMSPSSPLQSSGWIPRSVSAQSAYGVAIVASIRAPAATHRSAAGGVTSHCCSSAQAYGKPDESSPHPGMPPRSFRRRAASNSRRRHSRSVTQRLRCISDPTVANDYFLALNSDGVRTKLIGADDPNDVLPSCNQPFRIDLPDRSPRRWHQPPSAFSLAGNEQGAAGKKISLIPARLKIDPCPVPIGD